MYEYKNADGSTKSIEYHIQNPETLIMADDWNGTDPISEDVLDPVSKGKAYYFGYSPVIWQRVYKTETTYTFKSVVPTDAEGHTNAYKLIDAIRYSVFNMVGGTIDGGVGPYASVMLLNGGYFNFTGGEVKNHISNSGGGIYIGQSGSNIVNFNGRNAPRQLVAERRRHFGAETTTITFISAAVLSPKTFRATAAVYVLTRALTFSKDRCKFTEIKVRIIRM